MAGYDGSIRINTSIDQRGFERGSRGLIQGMTRLGNSLRGMVSSLGFGLGIAGLVALGKQAIDTASDIQEVQNVVDTAFGSMSYKMEEFAKTSVKQFGLSQLAAKEIGSTFMAMASNMVGSAETASDMAINLTKRAADMASFYNRSAEDTATALHGVFTGETEVLKQYGIVQTEVNLQEFAASQGINKKISAMTQAEKVQLRYNYVMQQTALAAGDFARTSDSWANQTRILSEQFKELASVIGGGLIAALTPVVKFLNTILTMAIAVAKQIGALLGKLFGISVPIASAAKGASDIATGMSNVADNADSAAGSAGNLKKGLDSAGKAAKKAGDAAKRSLAPFDKLNVLSKEASGAGSGGSGGGGSGGGGGGAGGGGGFQMPQVEMKEEAQEADVLGDALGRIFDVFKQAWENKGQKVIESAQGMLKSLNRAAKEVGKTLFEVFTNGTGLTWLESDLELLRSVFDVVSAIADSFTNAWTSGSGFDFITQIFNTFTAINDLLTSINDTITEAFRNGTGTDWIQSVLDKWTAILGVVETLAATLETAWNSGAGLEFVESFLIKWTEINNLITTIADSFSRIWDNGTGVEIWTNILGIVSGVNMTIANLASQLTEAWNTAGLGDGIWQGILNIVNTILETIHGIADSTAEWAAKLDFTPLLTSINDLLTSLQPLTENIGTGLQWFWDNVLLPIAGWTIQEAVPTFLNMLSEAITVVNNVIDALKPLGTWLWDSFLQPIGKWTGDLVISAMETITDLLDKFGNWISENKPIVEGFVTVIGSFMAAWGVVNLAVTIGGIVTALASFVTTGGLATAAATALGTAIGILTSPITIAVAAIGTIIAAGVLLYKNWDKVKEAAGKLKEKISEKWGEIKAKTKETWENVKSKVSEKWGQIKTSVKEGAEAAKTKVKSAWESIKSNTTSKWDSVKTKVSNAFSVLKSKSGIADTIKTTVVNAWQSIKSKTTSIWNGIKNAVKSPINAIIGFLNTLISGISSAINGLTGMLNNLNIDIPDWVPGVGGKSLGFNIPKVNAGKIPYLASGAVIRGGDPFMAVLGDQPRNQTNIETPLPTMVNAFKQAMVESGGAGGEVSVRVYLGEKDITKAVKTEADTYYKRTGKPLFGY